MHPFEKAGLGKAPFKFLSMEDKGPTHDNGMRYAGQTKDGFDMYVGAGGSCAYCGTYICLHFNVESADGKKFHVGSDCIEKINQEDPMLAKQVSIELRKYKSKQRLELQDKKIKEVEQIIEENKDVLIKLPHPKMQWRTDKTMLDYCNWIMVYGGKAGKIKLKKLIEKELNVNT